MNIMMKVAEKYCCIVLFSLILIGCKENATNLDVFESNFVVDNFSVTVQYDSNAAPSVQVQCTISYHYMDYFGKLDSMSLSILGNKQSWSRRQIALDSSNVIRNWSRGFAFGYNLAGIDSANVDCVISGWLFKSTADSVPLRTFTWKKNTRVLIQNL